MKSFSAFLLSRRESLGLTLDQVGKVAGVNPTTIHNLETGKNQDLKLSTALGLCKALRLDPIELVNAYIGKEDSPGQEVGFKLLKEKLFMDFVESLNSMPAEEKAKLMRLAIDPEVAAILPELAGKNQDLAPTPEKTTQDQSQIN